MTAHKPGELARVLLRAKCYSVGEIAKATKLDRVTVVRIGQRQERDRLASLNQQLAEIDPESIVLQLPDDEPHGGAFLTGSRAYGVPRPNSDCDVAVLLTPEEIQILRTVAEETGGGGNRAYQFKNDGAALRFGRLNLIAFADRTEFLAWQAATDTLKARAPVSRQQAIDEIDAEFIQRTGKPRTHKAKAA